jgi:ABC-type multidrug transport system fused ATPase/permease subunit
VPLCVAVIRMAGKRLAARARALQARSGDLSAALTESLQSPLEIRAYNLEERQIANFRERIREMLMLSTQGGEIPPGDLALGRSGGRRRDSPPPCSSACAAA